MGVDPEQLASSVVKPADLNLTLFFNGGHRCLKKLWRSSLIRVFPVCYSDKCFL